MDLRLSSSFWQVINSYGSSTMAGINWNTERTEKEKLPNRTPCIQSKTVRYHSERLIPSSRKPKKALYKKRKKITNVYT